MKFMRVRNLCPAKEGGWFANRALFLEKLADSGLFAGVNFCQNIFKYLAGSSPTAPSGKSTKQGIEEAGVFYKSDIFLLEMEDDVFIAMAELYLELEHSFHQYIKRFK